MLGGGIGVGLLLAIFIAYSEMVVFDKAGEKPWKALIPILYNYVVAKIAGKRKLAIAYIIIQAVCIVYTSYVGVNVYKSYNRLYDEARVPHQVQYTREETDSNGITKVVENSTRIEYEKVNKTEILLDAIKDNDSIMNYAKIFNFALDAIMFFVYFGLAERFDRSILFALGLVFLPLIFFPILAFSDSYYHGEIDYSPVNYDE